MVITSNDIRELIEYFSKNTYRANNNAISAKSLELQAHCEELFSLDYKIKLINNEGGVLSMSYPPRIIVPIESLSDTNERFPEELDDTRLRNAIERAKMGRCRTRFPVPTILYGKKFICRSSTLSGGPEIYGRHSINYLFPGHQEESEEENDDPDGSHLTTCTSSTSASNSDWVLFDKVRSGDIKLLRMLEVQTICDLMVENKKVKYGMNVSSSEKVDKEKRYSDFTIVGLPYPGCEFFRIYKDNCYNPIGLVYDWNQSFNDAQLVLPENLGGQNMDVNWGEYKRWDLLHLTQNYLQLMIKIVGDNTPNGLLVHCISGWDRTPLYISLLRLSLWADGKIHKSLSSLQILYLTLTYDWFLFGHNLMDRLSKGEEILHFCFDILKHITNKSFESIPDSTKLSETSIEAVLLEESMHVPNNVSDISTNSNGTTDTEPWLALDISIPSSHHDGDNNNGLSCASSPVAVPMSRIRHRTESGSSTGFGSWQVINDCGSVKGSTRFISYIDEANLLNQTVSSNSKEMPKDTSEAERSSKLNEVRQHFKKAYCSLSYNRSKTDNSFGAIIEKVMARI